MTSEEAPKVEPRWLSVRDAAKYVGVSRFTIYRAAQDGRIVVTRFGRRLLVDRVKLDELLASGGFGPSTDSGSTKA